MAGTDRTAPPFRAEHIGSLLRPRVLQEGFRAHRDGALDATAFTRLQDDAIRDAVAMQERLGLQAITDGEFRRASYWSHFAEKVDGFAVRKASFTFSDATGEQVSFTAPYAEAPIVRRRGISTDEFSFLQDTTRRCAKITLPSAPTMHFYRLEDFADRAVYADEARYFDDLARIYREELAALAALGARYVQIDEVPLALLCDASIRARVAALGHDPEALVGRYVDLINACLENRPASLSVGLHLCRGNYRGRWVGSGGYDAVAERLFGHADVDAFFLEYDSDRAGDFSPLVHLAADKRAILGLVSTKTPALEAPDALRRRIDEAARVVSHERLGLSPQCGFASTVGGNPVTLADQERKLALVVAVAETVWGSA